MIRSHLACWFTVGSLMLQGAPRPPKVDERSAEALVRAVVERLEPLSREAALASFEASVSGKDEDYARAEALQLQVRKVYADPDVFEKLAAFRSSKALKDPILKRQVEVLYLGFLGNRLPEATLAELVKRQTEIEKRFNTFRATFDGRSWTDNEVEAILRQSTDSETVAKAWKASKEVGGLVASQVRDLVKLRNRAARELGFPNFHVMQLALGEQEPREIERLFDELDRLTRPAYQRVKAEVDAALARRFGIRVEELRPWHYQDRFFQEAPKIHAVDLDDFYKDKDLVPLVRRYYAGLGLPVEDILARSDLYEKPGKYQHAFCTDIDRSGDVRILCSLKSNAYWANTLLHELGHAVYAKFNDPQLPWLLRDAAHAFTTEAIANLFGRYASNPRWLQEMAGLPEADRVRLEQVLKAQARLEQLVFSRWSQVMFRFEKALYEDPDQDLDDLWWRLVERYQLLRRPEGRRAPDWASKIHVALYPAYYHNYLLGQLLASQIQHHVATRILGVKDWTQPCFAGHPDVGRYLVERIFRPGMRWRWDELIRRATGEPLTAAYYAQQFVR